jgi:hypothetical protein
MTKFLVINRLQLLIVSTEDILIIKLIAIQILNKFLSIALHFFKKKINKISDKWKDKNKNKIKTTKFIFVVLITFS